jgi:FAD/FMN-containing dehydrogenase
MLQCEALSAAGLTHVLYPGDKQYENRTSSYWSVSAQLTPYCVVQPLGTEQVSTVLKTLVGHGACRETKFAIRSGGHTTWSGSNNIKDGVTVDLGLMNTTTLDPTTRIASVQPGTRWGRVYGTLDPLGFTVAGGRAASVGVAGFLTGGMISFDIRYSSVADAFRWEFVLQRASRFRL